MSAVKQAKNNEPTEKRSIRIERGIYRVNYPSHKGYRAYVKFKDTEYQKVFSLVGGEEKALEQAKQWREEKLREIQNSPEANNPLKKLMSNNTSGVSGVRRGKTAWGATWQENGKQFHRSFAVEKHGEDEAFKLACKMRAEVEKRLYGHIQDALKNLIQPPNAPKDCEY